MKIVFLCVLATLAFAQDDMDGSAVPLTERAMELETIQENYLTQQAYQARRDHLFCLNRTTTIDDEGNADVGFTEFEQRGQYVWTLFIQIPVITYLDPQRKLSLMDTIMKVLNVDGYNASDICIGTYEMYRLSYFRESVLIHVYGSGFDLNAEDWSERFNSRVEDQLGDDNGYVIRYPGQSSVIAFNFSTSVHYTDLIQPSQETNEGVDLTSLAVFIGSYGYNYTFEDDTEDGVSRDIDDAPGGRRNFADNTNPINYGLEPGDYVFSIFGAILTALVCGLIILGYFIHPFWFA